MPASPPTWTPRLNRSQADWLPRLLLGSFGADVLYTVRQINVLCVCVFSLSVCVCVQSTPRPVGPDSVALFIKTGRPTFRKFSMNSSAANIPSTTSTSHLPAAAPLLCSRRLLSQPPDPLVSAPVQLQLSALRAGLAQHAFQSLARAPLPVAAGRSERLTVELLLLSAPAAVWFGNNSQYKCP